MTRWQDLKYAKMTYCRRGKKCSQLQAWVFDKMKAGEKIMVTVIDGGRVYTLGNRVISSTTIDGLCKLGWIRPIGDGLLSGISQTWVMRQPGDVL